MTLLFKKKKPQPPKRTLDDIVRELFDSEDRDIPAFASAMGMSVPDLYFAVKDPYLRGNIKGFAGRDAKAIINEKNDRLIFGRNAVLIAIPDRANLRFEHLEEGVEYLREMAMPGTPLKMFPHDIKQHSVMFSLTDVKGDTVLGVITQLSKVQFEKILERFKGIP